MNCRYAERQIFAERDGALDASQRTELAGHTAQCNSCRRVRDDLAAAIESWRVSTRETAVPDADREWRSLQRAMRSTAAPALSATRRMVPWLAPMAAAAAIAIGFYVSQTPAPSAATRTTARSDAVEVSAADGSVVYVDDKSGWVVVWEGDTRQI